MSAFERDADGNWRAPSLNQQPWLRHGFGNRFSKPPDLPLATLKQIHSAGVAVIEAAGRAGEGDALITAVPGLAVGIKTADCFPILLADPEHRVVAAVHAGWRGTVQRIAEHTIERMAEIFGTNPEKLVAAIGPGIGRCCFEVGPEVAREFATWFPELANLNHKTLLDLEAINATQLASVGVGTVERSELCTMTRVDEFYSFRKEREAAGRMLSWIALV